MTAVLVYLYKFLGMTPAGIGKTGKRESAWTLILIALALTILAMWYGVDMVSATTAVLMTLWGAAIAAIAGAYKLEHDKTMRPPPAADPNHGDDDLAGGDDR